MSLPQEVEDYIKGSIDHFVGLPTSAWILELKLVASDSARRQLHDRCIFLESKLKDQEHATKGAREEARLNGQALKKSIQRNGELTAECSRLSAQINQSQAIMNAGNAGFKRPKIEVARVCESVKKRKDLAEDLRFFKHEHEMRKFDSTSEGTVPVEEDLLQAVLTTLIGNTELSAREFLEENIEHPSCRRLLHLAEGFRPSTERALSMACKIKDLEGERDELKALLFTIERKAEELSDGISMLAADYRTPMASYKEEICEHYARKPPARKPLFKVKPKEESNGKD